VILGSLVGLILITAVTNAGDDPTPNAAATPTPSALSTAPTPAPTPTPSPTHTPDAQPGSVLAALYDLKVVSDDAADSADFEYDRDEFGKAWKDIDRNGCDQRNDVLRRDLTKRHTKPGTNGCVLASGVLKSEYTGKTIKFTRGDGDIAIDHVVSLAEAWRTGASDWKKSKREKFANDPFNLEAVETDVYKAKEDEPPVYWIPDIEQCDYTNRYLSIKHRYRLGVTQHEREWLLKEWVNSCDVTVKLYDRDDYKTPKAKPIGEPKPKPPAAPRPQPTPEQTAPQAPSPRVCRPSTRARSAPTQARRE